MKTLVAIIRWFFGVMFCFAGFGAILKGNFSGTFFMLSIGLLLLPPVTKRLFKKNTAKQSVTTPLKASPIPAPKPAPIPAPKPIVKSEAEIKQELVDNILKNITFNVTITNPKDLVEDESIIDVTGESYEIETYSSLKKYSFGIPQWSHTYIYSYSEITRATPEQKRFYEVFKASFLNGEYYDLEENTNYAFILLFDLLNEYETHKEIPKLEKQLHTLGQCYPKTKSYGISFLIKIMEEKGDNNGIIRLKNMEQNAYQNDYGGEWLLGTRYKSILDLSKQEVSWLNKVTNYSNVFNSIDGCRITIAKFFLATIKQLDKKLKKKESSISKEISFFKEAIKKSSQEDHTYYWGPGIEHEIYTFIFKRCENVVREAFSHKRKLSDESPYSFSSLKDEFENRIAILANGIIQELSTSITPPDEATEIELNLQNTNRWKNKFENLTINYNGDSKQFLDDIISLGNQNKKNRLVENIFYEASKFISKGDKEAALTLYIYYLYFDLNSSNFDNKQLAKTIQKSLFTTNEQLHEFGIIVSELVKNKDLDKALRAIPQVYTIKRKKIQLDTAAIKEVNQKHSGTVELLNEYLKDEYEDSGTTIKTQEINDEEVRIEITTEGKTLKSSTYSNEIEFTEIQQAALELFSKSNFCISQSDFEVFAKNKGAFKNQLIESINEICYSDLDDILIEEDDEFYIINENYYKRLLST